MIILINKKVTLKLIKKLCFFNFYIIKDSENLHYLNLLNLIKIKIILKTQGKTTQGSRK